MGLEFRSGLAGTSDSGFLNCNKRAEVILKVWLAERKIHFQAHYYGFRTLLAISWRHQFLARWASPQGSSNCKSWLLSKWARESAQSGIHSIFNLILYVTFHHFCCFLFITWEPLSPAHTQREETARCEESHQGPPWRSPATLNQFTDSSESTGLSIKEFSFKIVIILVPNYTKPNKKIQFLVY